VIAWGNLSSWEKHINDIPVTCQAGKTRKEKEKC